MDDVFKRTAAGIVMTYEDLQKQVRAEFPRFKEVPKRDSLLMKVIHFLLLTLTLGGMSYFQKDFTTTVGYTVYLPLKWGSMSEVSRMIVLRHERVHMRQRRKYGALLFSFLYAFVPLPCIFAYFRMRFEMEAYAESLRAMAEYQCQVGEPEQKARFIGYFTGPSYFWTWPWKRRVEKWYDSAVKEALKSV